MIELDHSVHSTPPHTVHLYRFSCITRKAYAPRNFRTEVRQRVAGSKEKGTEKILVVRRCLFLRALLAGMAGSL